MKIFWILGKEGLPWKLSLWERNLQSWRDNKCQWSNWCYLSWTASMHISLNSIYLGQTFLRVIRLHLGSPLFSVKHRMPILSSTQVLNIKVKFKYVCYQIWGIFYIITGKAFEQLLKHPALVWKVSKEY